MHIYFTKPAKNFNEALPLGNGRLGVMAYGLGVYGLNESTLYSGKPLIDENPSDEMLAPMGFIKDGLYAYRGKESRYGKLFKEKLTEVKKLILQEKYSLANAFADEWLQGGFSGSFMPFGVLRFDFVGDLGTYYRELDLLKSTHQEHFMLGKNAVSLVSIMRENGLELELSASKGIDFSLSFEGELLMTSFYKEGYFVAYGKCPSYASPYREEEAIIFEEGEGIGFLGGVKIQQVDGELEAKSVALNFKNTTILKLSLNIVSGFLGFDSKPISDGRSLFSLFKKSFSKESERVKSLPLFLKFNQGKNRFSSQKELNLQDKIALLFHYGIYLHCASSNKFQPSNLQGIWCDSIMSAWSSNYTTNINLQMNYLIAPFLGRDDSIEPLLCLCEELSVTGALVAKELYGARGWCLHHNSDLYRHAYPTGNGAQHTLWCLGSAWLVLTLQHYLDFNPLSNLKERIQALLLPCSLFYVDIVTKIDGKYHTLPSSSPENSFKDLKTGQRAALSKSSALDISLLKELFSRTLNGLSKQHSNYKEIQEIFENLASHQINKKGEIAEWYAADLLDFEPKHRHLSQLYDLYPGNLFYKDERLLRAAIKSLQNRGIEGTGWSLVWKIAIYARLKDVKKVKILLKKLCKNAKNTPSPFHHLKHNKEIDFVKGGGLYKNFLLAHPPFQIDASLGISAALMELFIQSHLDYIEILPCYFEELGSGKLAHLRLRGGISFALSFGLRGFKLELKADFTQERVFCYRGIFKAFTLTPKVLKLTQKDFDENF